MKKSFIVNTPFGIGFATSGEDLKDMLSFIEGFTGEGAERSEAQQPEEACDCENCQHNARVSEEKINLFSLFLSSVDELATLAFIEKDLTSDMNATFLALGEGHPQVIHFEKMLDLLKERIAEVSSEDAAPETQLSEEQLLERLSEDIAQVNKTSDLTVLQCFRQFMTTVLESDNPNKKREAELLIEKIDEQIARLEGENEPEDAGVNPVENVPTEKPLPAPEDIDEMTDHKEVGELQIELDKHRDELEKRRDEFGYGFEEKIKRIKSLQALAARRKAVLLADEEDAARAEKENKVEGKSAWEKRDPSLLGLYHVSSTVDIGSNMLASIDLGYTVDKEEMTNFVRRSTEILNELLKSEAEKMNAPEAPVEDSPDEELQGKHAFSFEAINDMTDYDELDKLQIELEGKMNQLSDKKQAEVDRFHEEMKRLEDLHTIAAGRKAAILDNKADIAHADMADKVKALQEAITRSQPHLLIHDDILEAMEILRERYSKQ